MTHIILDIKGLTLDEKSRLKKYLKDKFKDRLFIYNLEVEQ